METQILQDPYLNLDHRVDAFEEARRLNPRVDLASFLPPRDHPRFVNTLAELIRVELDAAWAADESRPLSEYVLRFPELADDRRVLQEVAFEEYRLRRQAGQNATPGEYTKLFDIDTSDWPQVPLLSATDMEPDELLRSNREANLLRGVGVDVLAGIRAAARAPVDSWVASVSNDAAHQRLLKQFEVERPESAKRWAAAINSMPEVGCKFLGFRLVEELGRGAFGRVFLAQQADLANRLVALKVGTDIFEESQSLAQLQHTNIVPIFSFHQVGKLQAVCMPYYGSTTLDHVLSHIQSMAGLPRSGKDLISTMHGRKSATREPLSRSHSWMSRSAQRNSTTPGQFDAEAPLPDPPTDNKPVSETWKLLEGMTFTDAVLWLAIRLVDGLAHAHEHGVLHRDLKPANVLLTDDGTPMLLDFNLATHSELRGDAMAARIGGTLPYMAPEHLRAFEGARIPPDERSDIYSLGIILFNLLTGRHPFPSHKGKVHDIVKLMLDDRRKSAPGLRHWNKNVTPALEAIVRKCLAADPADRYQHTRQLQEDLECQLRHLPLKHTPEPSLKERADKFACRHPYLTSTASVCSLALAAVLAMGVAWYVIRERVLTLTARNEYAMHEKELRGIQALLDERSPPASQIDRGLEQSKRELARFGLKPDAATPSWEKNLKVEYLDVAQRQKLREDIGEVYFLMAKAAVMKGERAEGDEREEYFVKAEQWNALADNYSGERLPRSVLEQRAGILKKRGLGDQARKVLEELAKTNPQSPRDHYLLGHWLVKEGQYVKALPHLRKATQDDPEMFSAWFVRGNAHLALGQAEAAAECYCSCIALRPTFAPAWCNRATAYEKMIFHEWALADLDRAIELDPNFAKAYVDRAGVLLAVNNPKAALADFERVTRFHDFPTRVYFLSAQVRARLGDRQKAEEDFARGLKDEPRDAESYLARAIARRECDPKAALDDLNNSLKLDPILPQALQEKAHVLSEKLHRVDEAMEVLNKTVELHPDHVPALAGRGVILARQGKRDEALRDAEAALMRDTKSPNLYQVGCIYALTSKQNPDDRVHALRYLSQALRTGFGLDWVDGDTDLDPLRDLPEFQKIVGAAKDLEKVRAGRR